MAHSAAGAQTTLTSVNLCASMAMGQATLTAWLMIYSERVQRKERCSLSDIQILAGHLYVLDTLIDFCALNASFTKLQLYASFH